MMANRPGSSAQRIGRRFVAVLTTGNSATISIGQKRRNVRMTFENTTRFLDFQAEYEGSIPFTRSIRIPVTADAWLDHAAAGGWLHADNAGLAAAK